VAVSDPSQTDGGGPVSSPAARRYVSVSERGRVERLSRWYLTEQLDFDRRMIGYRYRSIKPHLKGPRGLELGPAEGLMTRMLVDDFSELTVVDGAAELLARIPSLPTLTRVHALFEEFEPEARFDTIVMDHILEHVDDPVALLSRARGWLAAAGRVVLGVPNGDSFHRLAGVKMGLLRERCELNQRDRTLGHRRVYTRHTLFVDLEAAALQPTAWGGVFFKPLSNQQIQDHWTEPMIEGFYELGKDFPEHANELFAVCEARS
jgi:2-polyprenyl-3-methyl-5-hydroxy-6-metoxy-1,4-benzoquinol methylase